MPDVLRPGLLEGVCVLTAGVPPSVAARVEALGASASGPPDVLVTGATKLGEPLAEAWAAARDVVLANWADEATPGGKVVLVGPRGPVGAALENLARTLGTEWSRYAIRVTAVVGGTDADVAELVAFLASPAGDYYTGCTFSLTS